MLLLLIQQGSLHRVLLTARVYLNGFELRYHNEGYKVVNQCEGIAVSAFTTATLVLRSSALSHLWEAEHPGLPAL